MGFGVGEAGVGGGTAGFGGGIAGVRGDPGTHPYWLN